MQAVVEETVMDAAVRGEASAVKEPGEVRLTPQPGGRCQKWKADGYQCRNLAIRNRFYCHRHGAYHQAKTQRTIEVPLLEDAASIQFVLSQTARALAAGDIPAENGQAVRACCKDALAVLEHQLRREKFEARERRRGAAAGAAATQPAELPVLDPVEVEGEWMAPRPGGAAEPAPAPAETVEARAPIVARPRFPKVKERWERELARAESKVTDLYYQRPEDRKHRDEDEEPKRPNLLDEYFGRVGGEEATA